ncbi:MAG: ClpX C4-type zinc finger protein [Desulfobacterales bacterium]
MNANVDKPPPVIHSARTLFYAVNDDSVEFTGRINLFVGDNLEKLGEMPLLAICENYCVPGDILLFFCNEDWEPQGTIGLDSVDAAKEKAEVGYKGINEKWVNAEASKEELNNYLRDVYEVDPDTEWWKVECAFCGKDDSEVNRMLGSANEKTYICDNCIRALYEIINEENNA